jgi:hypothetical protein
MARQIDHKHAFGPRALNSLAQALEDAWQEVGAQINQETGPEQIELTRAKLAQWIINYATIGKLDEENVEELKEHALLGLRCSAELGVWRRHD